MRSDLLRTSRACLPEATRRSMDIASDGPRSRGRVSTACAAHATRQRTEPLPVPLAEAGAWSPLLDASLHNRSQLQGETNARARRNALWRRLTRAPPGGGACRGGFAGMSAAERAELVPWGGRTWRGSREQVVDVVAVGLGRMRVVGTAADVGRVAGPATGRLQLAGRLAVPAFVEAHRRQGAQAPVAVLSRLRAGEFACRRRRVIAQSAAAAGRGGASPARGLGSRPRRLGRARHRPPPDGSGTRPRCCKPSGVIKRICGHMLVVNSAAPGLAGVTAETLDPQGGAIGRENGRLTGLSQKRAMRLVCGRVPSPDERTMVAAIAAACRLRLRVRV